MNAIVALCHFCEMHGPSVLFCTQSFHSQDPNHVLNCSNEPTENKLHYGNAEQFVRSPATNSASESKASDACEACSSIESEKFAFISNDHDAKVTYASSQHPYHPEVFSIVRQACVRSLSCEVCPGREGPIFFGDNHRGHVFSHTFFVKDSQARGFQRWYSIIVVMMDKIFLLNSWPFLVKHVKAVIDELQSRAEKVYQGEQADCPQRALRLSTSMTPGNFRRQWGGKVSMRSLVDLTNEHDLFAHLHLSFTWIIRAGGNRMTEKLLEGPPTEDMVIDFEKQEETEEGFIKLYTRDESIGYQESQAKGDSNLETNTLDLANDTGPQIKNLRHFLQLIGEKDFHGLLYHVITGNQVIVRCKSPSTTISCIKVLKTLLPKGCCRDISYQFSYEESFRCNFLGLSPSAALPPDRTTSEHHVILDIKAPPAECGVNDTDEFTEYRFILTSGAIIPDLDLCPTVVQKIERAVHNSDMSNDVLDCFLITIKEEWMNKVKVVFKFSRAESRSLEDREKLMALLHAQKADEQILKFWMTGLSLQYKKHILSSTVSQE